MAVEEIKSYRDLIVWQRAVTLVTTVYAVVRSLPPEERFVLGSQIRRAVVSVPANVAEGQARQHTKEYLQCLYIARGSLAEVETLLIVAERLGHLDPQTLTRLQEEVVSVRKPLHGLISGLRFRQARRKSRRQRMVTSFSAGMV
jgi:four helix bundle protein